MSLPISPDAVEQAARRILGQVHRTPIHTCQALADRTGSAIAFKAENFQKTGSYKARGALNAALLLTPDALAQGLVTVSAGNFAQALAWAAGRVGARSVVVMPASAPRSKIEGTRGYGAEVLLVADGATAFAEAERLAREEGLTFVHPFDAPEVIAGQGTVGLEILEQVPEVTRVIVPVGGGGLIAGICVGLGALRPDIEIWGVEPVGAAAMSASLDEGIPVRLPQVQTIADGLAAPMAGQLTYPIVRDRARDVVTVTDPEIGVAMGALLERAKLFVEPAGAAGLAGLLSGRIPSSREGVTVVIASGGNADPERIATLLAGG